MEISAVIRPEETQAGALALLVAEPVGLGRAGSVLDGRLQGRLSQLVADGELGGLPGRVTLLHTDGRLPAPRLLAVGIGPVEQVDADALRTASAAAAARALEAGARSLALVLDEPAQLGLDPSERARALVEGALLGSYDPGRWKTGEHEPQLEQLTLCGEAAATIEDAAREHAAVARWTNECRDLVNTPPNELTPAALADWADGLAGRLGLRATVLGPEELRAAGMGGILAVGAGSAHEPRLVTVAYEPPDRARPELVLGLVGKAVTFDSGGISIKPAAGMDRMKGDMGGGAAVLCALGAIAELRLPVRVLAVIAACENMLGPYSYRPGDVLTVASGKTVEVTNTDAEGRIVLADALWAAREGGASHIVDLATLTGGVTVALGDLYAGLFGNDQGWVGEIRAAAEASGDHAWPLPLHDSYRRYLRSTYADLKNSSESRQATPTVGAHFLQEFAGDGAWAHLDIAGTAFLERPRGDYLRVKGASGYGVRLLVELARQLSRLGR